MGKVLFIHLERRRYDEESYQVRQLSQIEFGMSMTLLLAASNKKPFFYSYDAGLLCLSVVVFF